MISYSLAKQLKDAGFPFKEVDTNFELHPSTYPTLSELIEACGENIVLNIGYNGYTWAKQDINVLDFKMGVGKTPEKAVANLYLELNKSKVAEKLKVK